MRKGKRNRKRRDFMQDRSILVNYRVACGQIKSWASFIILDTSPF